MSKKILSIDDSKMVHMVIAKTLKAIDVEVLTASNGQEGFEKAQQTSPDLILLDATMPVLDGLEALAKLKEAPDTKNIPVVMLSADAAKENTERATQLGALQFVSKPFTSDGLIAVLLKYIELPARA